MVSILPWLAVRVGVFVTGTAVSLFCLGKLYKQAFCSPFHDCSPIELKPLSIFVSVLRRGGGYFCCELTTRTKGNDNQLPPAQQQIL